MRFNTAQYLEKEQVTISIRNDESSAVIYDGMPVIFQDNDNKENLGVDVVTYNTSAKRTLAAGLAKCQKSTGLAAGDVGECVVYGFTDAYVALSTRTNSTIVTVASAADITAGDVLIPSTKGGGYLVVGASTDPLVFIAAQSLAGLSDNPHTATNTPSASNWSSDNKALIKRMKVFVRSLL